MAADERWYFTREQLANTPSRKCGIDADKELSYRQQAANFIQDMGQRLVVYPFFVRAYYVRRSVASSTLLDRISHPPPSPCWFRVTIPSTSSGIRNQWRVSKYHQRESIPRDAHGMISVNARHEWMTCWEWRIHHIEVSCITGTVNDA